MTDFLVTIFHNPACGTSRNVLAMIRAAGYEPAVVDYLRTGWTRPRLEALLAAMRLAPRDIMRVKGTPAADLGLLEGGVTDDMILDAMIAHPVLVDRPIVMTPLGVKLSRPSESVFDVLEHGPRSFTKESGEVVEIAGKA